MRPFACLLLLPLAAALGGCGVEFAAGALAGGVAGHEIAGKNADAEPTKAAPEKPEPAKEAAETPAPAKTAAAVPVPRPRPLPPRRKEEAAPAAGAPVSPENRQMFEDFLKSRGAEEPPAP